MHVGNLRPLEELGGIGANIGCQSYRACAVHDPVIGIVTAHDEIRAGQNRRQDLFCGIALAGLLVKKDWTGLSIVL